MFLNFKKMRQNFLLIFSIFVIFDIGEISAQKSSATDDSPTAIKPEAVGAKGEPICRVCRSDCIEVGKSDGSCPGCICNGLLLPDCPNLHCQPQKDSTCGPRITTDGCAECVCVPNQRVTGAGTAGTNPQTFPGNQKTPFNRQRPSHGQGRFPPGNFPGNPNSFRPGPSFSDPSSFNQGHTINTQGSFPQRHPESFPQRHSGSFPQRHSGRPSFATPSTQNRFPPGQSFNQQGTFPGGHPFERPDRFVGQRPTGSQNRFPPSHPINDPTNFPPGHPFSSQGNFPLGPPFANQDTLPNPDREQIGKEQIDREVLCAAMPSCKLECQTRDKNGCPICDCSDRNKVDGSPLSDDPELCPPLPVCPVGCIETKLGGEFDCYDCNCTIPEQHFTEQEGFGLGPGDLRFGSPSFGLGGPPFDDPGFDIGGHDGPIFDERPVCGETQCADGCRLCVGRDGCGRCLCGRDSNICPPFPRCKASCIQTIPGTGCLRCSCLSSPILRPILLPKTQSIIIRRIPPYLQNNFVSRLPIGVKQETRFSGNIAFESPELSSRLSPEILDEIILEFSPTFITRLPEKLKKQLVGHLLSFIRPRFHSALSPEFIAGTDPQILFRGPPQTDLHPTFSRPLIQNPVLVTVHATGFPLSPSPFSSQQDPSLFVPNQFSGETDFPNQFANPHEDTRGVNPNQREPVSPDHPRQGSNTVPLGQRPINDVIRVEPISANRPSSDMDRRVSPAIEPNIDNTPQIREEASPIHNINIKREPSPGPEVDAEPIRPRSPLINSDPTSIKKPSPPTPDKARENSPPANFNQNTEPFPISELGNDQLKPKTPQINDTPPKITESSEPQVNENQPACIGNECNDREYLQERETSNVVNAIQSPQSLNIPEKEACLGNDCNEKPLPKETGPPNEPLQPSILSKQPFQPVANSQEPKCTGDNCNSIPNTQELNIPSRANLIETPQLFPSSQDITCIGNECNERKSIQQTNTPTRFNDIPPEQLFEDEKNSECIDCNDNKFVAQETNSPRRPTQDPQDQTLPKEEILPVAQGRNNFDPTQQEKFPLIDNRHIQTIPQDRRPSVDQRTNVPWQELSREDKIRAQLIGLLESSAFDRSILTSFQNRHHSRSHPLSPFNPSHLFLEQGHF